MIVISDTSPLNYLVLLGYESILPTLFEEVLAPPEVIRELLSSRAPERVRVWAINPPNWLIVRAPQCNERNSELDPDSGEAVAIALAQECQCCTLLIDERRGESVATKLGLTTTGTIGVLALAAEKNLLSLQDAYAELLKTSFRAPMQLIDEYLLLDAQRLAKKPK